MGPTYHFLKHLPALKVKVNVTQLCPTLCNPMDYTIHGIFQARILEWMPFPSPGDLPNPGVEPRSPTLQADSLPSELPGKPTTEEEELPNPIKFNKIKCRVGGVQ